MRAEWAAADGSQVFAIDVEVRGQNRSSLLRDVSDTLARHTINVTAVQMNSRHTETALRLTLEVKQTEELPRVLASLGEVKGVGSVARV